MTFNRTLGQPGSITPGLTNEMETMLPGVGAASNSAMQWVQNLLKGGPSMSDTRNENAYWGANSGLAPGSEFLTGRGADLYRKKSDQYKQTGITDLLSMLQGVSGPYNTMRGQNITQQLGMADVNQRASANSAQNDIAQQQLQLQLLGTLGGLLGGQ